MGNFFLQRKSEHVYCKNIFSESRAVCEIMWKKYDIGQTGYR
jgi:hypothetical protein